MKKYLLWIFILAFPWMFAAKEVNLIWLSPGTMWETDWIREILSDTDASVCEIFDGNYETVLDHSVIVTSYPDKAKYQRYYHAFRDKGYKFGIIHLSDEAYDHPRDFYDGARFVLRNYWYTTPSQSNIHIFPLGYKEHFWRNYPQNKPMTRANERKYTWCFAGQIKKTTRELMYGCMKRIPQHYVHEIPHFAAPSMLSAEDYRDVLLNSTFAPCPRGNINLDTFRLYEALECGCIPIVEKSPNYFKQFLDDYPFPAVNRWDEAPYIVRKLLADPKALEELQQRCHAWWIEYKSNLKKRIAELIETL